MNVWKRLKPLTLSLIFAFALVVCPATRAFAATGTLGTVTAGTPVVRDQEGWVFDSADRYSYYTANNGRIYTINSTTNPNTGVISAYTSLSTTTKDFNTTSVAPFITVHTYYSIEIPFSYSTVTQISEAKYRQGSFSFNTYLSNSYTPSGYSIATTLFEVENVSVEGQYKTDFNYSSYKFTDGVGGKIRIDFSYPLRMGTGNTRDNFTVQLKCTATYKLNNQNTSITTLLEQRPEFVVQNVNPVSPPNWRDVEIADYTPFAHQNADNISAIAHAIGNNDNAAQALDQANANFVQDAAQLEQHQGILENAADASVGAVDMNQINLIDTYSASVSFWSQLIGQLPTVLGSLWYVFIFGLLLAFVLFVLRIRR